MTARSLALWILVAALCACGDDPPPPVDATLGGLDVTVSADPPRLEIRDGDVVLYDGLPGGSVDAEAAAPHVAFAVRRAEARYEFRFGSFKIEEDEDPERWRGVTSLRDLRREGDAILFDLVSGGEVVASGRVAAAGEGEIDIGITATGEQNRVSAAFACEPDEHFIGFGGQTFDVDQRGQTVPIWVQEDGIGKAAIDDYVGLWFLEGRRHSTHTPMPMYVSSRGYAMALDTPYRSLFAMCSEAEDVARIEVWEGELGLRLFAGETPAESIEKLTGWAGRPELPPAFAFAPWLDAIFGEENVSRVAQKLREEDIAVSVIWSEDWRGGDEEGGGYVLEEDWEVDRDQYPNFETLAEELHDEGYKFLIYHNSFLTSSAPVFDEAIEAGHTIRDAEGEPYLFDGVKFVPTTMLDLSSEAARAWAKQKFIDSLELGADGYMADFAEWLPHDAVLASGEDAVARHNLYPVDWQRLNREVLDEMDDDVERLFFVRSAYVGSQPLVSVVWAGDQQTDFTVGDGYPSVIPMGIGLGVTGFPFYGHDIGGYMSQGTEPTTKELWFRWVTLGALTPVMRTHHGREAIDNWNWESDEDSIAHMRRWTRFHMQLFPYLWGMARQATERGAPMFRPLAFDYPDFEPGWTVTDQYMLGDRLIVAPIVEEGATSRTVQLPDGDFYPLFGGEPVTGEVTTEAGIEEIPVFVPAGSILVLAPDSVDTTVAVGPESTAVTLESIGDDRELWLYAGGSSSWAETGGLDYEWSADGITAAPTSATYAGESVDLTADGDAFVADLVGPGTLELDTGATLTITGGDEARQIRVRIY